MRGTVLRYSPPSRLGAISGEDGNPYKIVPENYDGEDLRAGDRVIFNVRGNQAVDIEPERSATGNPKSRVTAVIFALLFGSFGIQFFYTGQWGWGLVSLLVCASGFPFFVGLVLGIRWLMMDDSAFRGKSGVGPFGKIPF